MGTDAAAVKALARDCGFDLAGITTADPPNEAGFYDWWLAQGYGGQMEYLYGRRAQMRADARSLLPTARSLICLGLLYNTPLPDSTAWTEPERAWISRYAWGDDYHDVMRVRMRDLVDRLLYRAAFEWKICVDTSPLLERAYAQRAGLGWIGHNTCLISQQIGSWVFLGEILTSLELEPDSPAPFRCGTCRRCIDACPTEAIVPTGRAEGPAFALDARLCISYWTIELGGAIPEEHRAQVGPRVFGCDICQDVCPWNRRAPFTAEPAFAPRQVPFQLFSPNRKQAPTRLRPQAHGRSAFPEQLGTAQAAPPLEQLAGITETEFRQMFRSSPVMRARYSGFLRNLAVAMGNSGDARFRPALEKLAARDDPLVREHAQWALGVVATDGHR